MISPIFRSRSRLRAVVSLLMTASSIPSILARSWTVLSEISYERTVWCAPPAIIQHSRPSRKDGAGFHIVLATGRLGIFWNGFSHSTSWAMRRSLPPISMRESAFALPALPSKTSLICGNPSSTNQNPNQNPHLQMTTWMSRLHFANALKTSVRNNHQERLRFEWNINLESEIAKY